MSRRKNKTKAKKRSSKAKNQPKATQALQLSSRDLAPRNDTKERENFHGTEGTIGHLPALEWNDNLYVEIDLFMQESYDSEFVIPTEECIRLIPQLYKIFNRCSDWNIIGPQAEYLDPEMMLTRMVAAYNNVYAPDGMVYLYSKANPNPSFKQHMLFVATSHLVCNINVDYLLKYNPDNKLDVIMLNIARACRQYLGYYEVNDYENANELTYAFLTEDPDNLADELFGEGVAYPERALKEKVASDFYTTLHFLQSGGLDDLAFLISQPAPSKTYFSRLVKSMRKTMTGNRVPKEFELVYDCVNALNNALQIGLNLREDYYDYDHSEGDEGFINAKTTQAMRVYFTQSICTHINEYRKSVLNSFGTSRTMRATRLNKTYRPEKFIQFENYLTKFAGAMKEYSWFRNNIELDFYEKWRRDAKNKETRIGTSDVDRELQVSLRALELALF